MPTAKRWKTRNRKDKQRLLPFRTKRQQLHGGVCSAQQHVQPSISPARQLPPQKHKASARARRRLDCPSAPHIPATVATSNSPVRFPGGHAPRGRCANHWIRHQARCNGCRVECSFPSPLTDQAPAVAHHPHPVPAPRSRSTHRRPAAIRPEGSDNAPDH